MAEQWRPIPEAPKYEVSSEGRVRNRKTGRILSLSKVGNTPVVSLMDAGTRITRSVPMLQTKAFAD